MTRQFCVSSKKAKLSAGLTAAGCSPVPPRRFTRPCSGCARLSSACGGHQWRVWPCSLAWHREAGRCSKSAAPAGPGVSVTIGHHPALLPQRAPGTNARHQTLPWNHYVPLNAAAGRSESERAVACAKQNTAVLAEYFLRSVSPLQAVSASSASSSPASAF